MKNKQIKIFFFLFFFKMIFNIYIEIKKNKKIIKKKDGKNVKENESLDIKILILLQKYIWSIRKENYNFHVFFL